MNQDWAHLNRLSKQREALYHQCAVRAGITDTKFWILYAICESGGVLCQNSFCENWCYSKQTVHTAAAGLEQDGILYLEFAEGSKKQKNLKLTEQGKRFCQQIIHPILEAECRSVSNLEPEERQKFFSAAEKMLSALEAEISADTKQ